MQAQLVDSPDLLVLRTPQQPSNHHHMGLTQAGFGSYSSGLFNLLSVAGLSLS